MIRVINLLLIIFVMFQSGCSAKETLAERNNNPVNLKAFVQWDGMSGKDKYGHAVFNSLDYGTRAALKNAQTRQRRRPDQTLTGWMNDFAEKNGDQQAYYIAGKMGISSDTKLKNIDMAELIIYQAWFEGRIELTPAYINEIKERFGL